MIKLKLILSVTFLCSISTTAFAGPPSEELGLRASEAFDGFFNSESFQKSDKYESNIRHRLFTEYRPSLPVTGDSFFEKTKLYSELCETATEKTNVYGRAFRDDVKKYKSEHWSSLVWLKELYLQAQAGCDSLKLAIEEFLDSRIEYDMNPEKYDKLGHLPKRITISDLQRTYSQKSYWCVGESTGDGAPTWQCDYSEYQQNQKEKVERENKLRKQFQDQVE